MAQTRKAKTPTMADQLDATATDAEARTLATLTALLRHRGLTQSEAARRLETNRSGFNAKLTGKTRLTLEDLAKFAAVLGVPIDILLLDPRSAIRWCLDNEEPAPGQTVVALRSKPQANATRVAKSRCSTAPSRNSGEHLPAA